MEQLEVKEQKAVGEEWQVSPAMWTMLKMLVNDQLEMTIHC